jgi:type VI secretion system secreted protein Hcp
MATRPSALLLRVFVRGILAWAVVIGVLSSSAADAASFIKFDGINGESQDKDHKDWSNVLSVDWGVSVAVVKGGGGVAGRPEFTDLSWTQTIDKSIPPLFSAITGGKIIRKATVDFTTTFGDGGRVTYFQMVFDDVLLTQLHLGSSRDANAELSGAFAYSKIGMTYTEYDAGGGKKGTAFAEYDLMGGRGSAAALAGVFALGASRPGAVIPVPEPQTWVTMLGGLGLLGWRSRRERSRGEATRLH